VAIVTPPHTIHYESVPTAWSCHCLAIDAPAQHPWPSVYRDDASRTFSGLCELVIREWAGQEARRDEMLSALMTQVDILLRRSYEQRLFSAAELVVREAERRLGENYAKGPRIRMLARELGVSQSYLRAQFARLRGRSPQAYLQTVRIQHAIALIRNSDVALEAIAEQCGYDSASHMSRYIRQATGRTPGSFRSN
jgi:AraC-like DNA-binding protein